MSDPTQSESSAFVRREPVILGLLLAAAVLFAYSNTLEVPFLLDDTVSIVENPTLRRLSDPLAILKPPANSGVGGRPVANLSFALNFAAGGLSVRGYHAVNLGIHLAAAFMMWRLVRRTLLLPVRHCREPIEERTAGRIAFGAAFLWALHPLQTEAVTYISQRTESLVAFLYLATLYAFLRGATAGSRTWMALSVVSCAVGMATKEIMVTAPVMVLLFDRTFLAGSLREAWQRRRRWYLALAASWGLLLFLLLDVHERGVGTAAVSSWHYALTSCRTILTYLRLAGWPAPLVFDYGTVVATGLSEVWPYVLAIGGLLLATAVALRRWPVAGLGAAWIFILLAPATSFVPVAGQTVAEHRMYLPLAALTVAAAWLAHRWLGRLALAATLGLGILLATATFARNRDYRNEVSLWTDTVAKQPSNPRAHAALGAALLAAGKLPAALASLERAVHLNPGLGEAQNNLATALHEAGRTAEAVRHFAAALKARPGVATTHYNFGNALQELGRLPEAIAQQEQALLLRRDFPEAACALALALSATGRRDEAIPRFRQALRLRPDLTPAHLGLANTLALNGDLDGALPHYEATVRAVPNSVEARCNYGVVLARRGRVAEAVRQFEAALQLRPDLEEARANLAALRALAPR
ncbi:MAG: tetratricopeptide repeat protein [Verrucomicrobia bacterium]|nr:tetratricopeptide repeat protein [Verrucomicrobiota bacterium]